VVVPQHILYRLPENISFSEGAMVEPLSIAFHAVSLTPIHEGDVAVVIGAGTIGLLTIQALKAKGVQQILAIDLDPDRLKLARELGATTMIQPDKVDAKEAVDSATGGKGVEIVFEAVGIAPTVTLATNLLRKGGALTLIGNLAPKTDLLLQAVVTRELRLQGSCASNGEYPECINAIASGAINLTPLMSAIAPLSEGAMYFERLYKGGGDLLKVILQP
jgi:L-iditol 2-dehydrogenase